MEIFEIYIACVIASYFANGWYVRRVCPFTWEMKIVALFLAIGLPIFSPAVAIACYFAGKSKHETK